MLAARANGDRASRKEVFWFDADNSYFSNDPCQGSGANLGKQRGEADQPGWASSDIHEKARLPFAPARTRHLILWVRRPDAAREKIPAPANQSEEGG
jgi:hypothetical protein